jgi:DNA-binding transcriptional regulator YhcF (GntR family)
MAFSGYGWFSSVTEQVAEILREGLLRGRWRGTMPGRLRLAAELGINHKTVKAALKILEDEGVLVSQGRGRERKIVDTGDPTPARLRVMLLLYEKVDLRKQGSGCKS